MRADEPLRRDAVRASHAMACAYAALVLAVHGCGGTRRLDLSVDAEPDLVARAASAEVLLLRGGCDSTRAVYREVASLAGGAPLSMPPPLEAGRWALSARLLDRSCVVFASGCEEIELPSERAALSVTVTEIDPEPSCPASACLAGICTPTDAGPIDAGPFDAGPPTMGPPSPRLLAPPHLASTGSFRSEGALRPTFVWMSGVARGVEHELEVSAPCTGAAASSCDFTTPIATHRGADVSFRPESPLLGRGARVAWRARTCEGVVCSSWTAARLLDLGRDAGDVDADGDADLVVGATRTSPEEGLVLVGGASGLTEVARRAGGGFGRALAVGDVDGDGRSEIYAGEPLADEGGALDAGRVLRIRGTSVDEVPLGVATAAAARGSAVCVVGDVDGDGFRDLAVGAPQYTSEGRVGAVLLVRGSTSGFEAPVLLLAPEPQADARFGAALAGADLDGDGYADLVVGEPLRRLAAGLDEAGAVYVFRGGASGLSTVPTVVIEGSASEERLGATVAVIPDFDGDGRDDLAAGAPGPPTRGVRVLSGSAMGPRLPGEAIPPYGASASMFGGALSGAGDLDGDGLGDLVVGAASEAPRGAVYVYLGVEDGIPTSPRILDDVDDVGVSVGIAGDLNADGIDDLALASSTRGVASYLGSPTGPAPVASTVLAAPAGASVVAIAQRAR